MGGLEPTIYLAQKARVMLTRNLWTSAGLCIGTMGTVNHIILAQNQRRPMLPIAVIVQFDKDDYIGPSFCENMPNCVPILPVTSHTNMTLFGKSRLNENSVEAFFRCNAFSTHCKCVEEHFQCVLKHCQCVSTQAKCVANPFKKHFQNVVNALANTDNAFNKTAAGCLESFTEPLLLDTMKSLL